MTALHQETESIYTPSPLMEANKLVRSIYAHNLFKDLTTNPAFHNFLTEGMHLNSDASQAVLKRMGILTAVNRRPTETATGLSFFSSDDLGKSPPKPAILIESAAGLNPAFKIDSPEIGAAMGTVYGPANEKMLKYSFVFNEILTSSEAEAAELLRQQNGWFARFVILDRPIQHGDASEYDFDPFLKTAYMDQGPIKFDRGVSGFMSKLGFGTVMVASKHGDQVHTDKLQKGNTVKTDTWKISPDLNGSHPLLGRVIG